MLIKRFSSKKPVTSYFWQHFGLLKNPFTELQEINEAYLPPSWELRLDLMQSAIKEENAVFAIIAKKGSGKTTFSSILLNQFIENYETYKLEASAITTLEAWIATLYDTFGIPRTETDALETQLDEWIVEIQHRPKPCILLIDDAGLWPEECLNALIYLIKQQSLTQMRFHCVLFGDIELQAKLAKIAKDDLNRDFIRTLEFEAFTMAEARQYLLHRLITAGLKEPTPITDAAFERIYEMSQGQPEDMNQEAQQWLIDEVDRQSAMIQPTFWQTYQTHLIGAGVIAAIALVVSVLFIRSPSPSKPKMANTAPSLNFAVAQQNSVVPPSQGTNTFNGNNVATAENASNTSANLAAAPNTVAANTKAPNATASTAPIASNSVPAMPQPSAAVGTLPATNTGIASNNVVAASSSSATNLKTTTTNYQNAPSSTEVNSIKNNTQNVVPRQDVVPTQPTMSNTMEKPVDSFNENIAQPTAKLKKASSNEPLANKTASNEKTKAFSHKKNIEKEKIAEKQKAKLAKTPHTASEQNGKYTLQLAALNSPEAAEKTIKQYHLAGKAHYIKRIVDGKTYYVVILGNYATSSAAKAAKEDLPTSVRNSVWLRKSSQA